MLHRAAIAIATLAVLATGCGAKEHKTAEEIQTEVSTTTSLLVVDGQPNSCGIFTAAEVKAFVGNSVSDGKDTGAGQGCYYPAQNDGSRNDGSSFLINLQADDSSAKFADAKSLASQQTPSVADVPGVGDEAFTYSPVDGGLASAEARKGTVRVRIVITGPQVTVEMAKTVLVAAVPKVPATH
jgi:hypothetical protein